MVAAGQEASSASASTAPSCATASRSARSSASRSSVGISIRPPNGDHAASPCRRRARRARSARPPAPCRQERVPVRRRVADVEIDHSVERLRHSQLPIEGRPKEYRCSPAPASPAPGDPRPPTGARRSPGWRSTRLRIRGRVAPALLARFEGMSAQVEPVETVLHGPLRDQAELHGALALIRALGLELVEVRRPPGAPPPDE